MNIIIIMQDICLSKPNNNIKQLSSSDNSVRTILMAITQHSSHSHHDGRYNLM